MLASELIITVTEGINKTKDLPVGFVDPKTGKIYVIKNLQVVGSDAPEIFKFELEEFGENTKCDCPKCRNNEGSVH